jgi:hypothetical protein
MRNGFESCNSLKMASAGEEAGIENRLANQ